MGLIFPSASPAISGAVGGTVYARNRYGLYARARVKPVNPRSTGQNAIRAIFQALSAAWSQTLTAVQRLAWTNWSATAPRTNRIGETITLPGNVAYVGANTLREQMGLTRVDNAPLTPGLATLTTPGTVTLNGGSLVLTGLADDLWQDVGGGMALFCSAPVSEGVSFFNGPYRYGGSILGNGTAQAAGTLTPSILANNSASTGAKVFYRLASSDAEGRPSPEIKGVVSFP